MLNTLKPQILNAVSDDFNKILEKVSLENIFAITLTTPEDFGSIRLCLGTIQDLFNMAKDEEFESIGYFSGLAWNPDEWSVSSDDVSDSKLDEINCIIGDNLDFLGKDLLLETYIESLKNIVCKDSIFKFVSTIEEVNIENYSSQLLNTEENRQLFLRRFEHLFDFYPPIKIKTKVRKLP